MDRTSALMSYIQAAEFSNEVLPSTSSSAQKMNQKNSEIDCQFNTLVGEFGVKIQQQNNSLDELSKLAQERGIFNNKTSVVNTATMSIKKSIDELDIGLEHLEKMHADSSVNLTQQAKEHRQNLLASLRSRLLQVTKRFKDVVDQRAESIQRQEDRRALYSSVVEDQTDSAAPWDLEAGQQVVVAAPQSTYQRSRAEAAESVRTLVVELGQMFTRVASMVHEQEDMVMRIDHDVESTLSNITDGEAYLMKYFKRITSSRALILKVFAMLISFGLLFVLFIA